MTTTANREFVDTNVLIYNAVPTSPFHPAAVARLADEAAAGVELWIGRQNLREYAAAMTRPGVASPPLTSAGVVPALKTLAANFRVAEDGPDVTDELLRLLAAVPCGGRQIHDANIVATMLAHGIPTLLTHNVADFQRFAAYITVSPLVP